MNETEDDWRGRMKLALDIPDGRLGLQMSGARCALVFTPSEENGGEIGIGVFDHIGPGTPGSVFNRRALIIGAVLNRDGKGVRAILCEHRDVLETLNARYVGAEWDGHNMVGRWEWEDDEEQMYLLAVLAKTLDNAPCYWAAADWLCPDEANVLNDAKDRDLDEYAAELCEDARQMGALLDLPDVANWLAERAASEEVMALKK